MAKPPQSKRDLKSGAPEAEAPVAPLPRSDPGGGRDAGPEAGPEALPGGLYLISTPIGNAQDITLRALDVLARADAIAAEDTRETLKLMGLHGTARGGRPLISYHDRNAGRARPRLEALLAEGKALAYCSDAGTPLISDPGYRLVEMALAGGHEVTALPGASALLPALQLSGLPSDRFLFAGFLPAKPGARARTLGDLGGVPATLIFYESPHRLAESLAEMAQSLGPRAAAVARELTKRFEEVRRGTLADLATHYGAAARPKGEIVVVVAPPSETNHGPGEETVDAALRRALERSSVKDAAREVAETHKLQRRDVYARALAFAKERQNREADEERDS